MRPKPRSTTPTNKGKNDATQIERLTALAEFLKACRARAKPESLNLPVRPRRRTPGLSRTEVATLAEISVDWYTWLEQGRDIHPSIQVLDRLADTFQLTPVERRHLYTLSNHASTPIEQPDADIQIMQRLIAHLPKAPAIILGKDWQVLAQNSAADEFFTDWSHLNPAEKNMLYLFFTEEIFTQSLRNWEWHAKITIRQFRAIYATEIGNPVFIDLIERLSSVSPKFCEWWAQPDVAGRDDGRKAFEHPVLGCRDYDYTILRPAENQAVEVVVFMPCSTSLEFVSE